MTLAGISRELARALISLSATKKRLSVSVIVLAVLCEAIPQAAAQTRASKSPPVAASSRTESAAAPNPGLGVVAEPNVGEAPPSKTSVSNLEAGAPIKASRDKVAAEKSVSAAQKSADTKPFLSPLRFNSGGPINIRSDTMSLDYKSNTATFKGHVHAVQADAHLTSEILRVAYGKDFHDVKTVTADQNVRLSQNGRWATSDHAVLNQADHTVVMTGRPAVHEGDDEITGTKITVNLVSGKSEVEGGARAIFFPKQGETRDNKQSGNPRDGAS